MSVGWQWAWPPDEALQGVARALENGALPADAIPVKEGRRRSVWAAPESAGGLVVKRFAASTAQAIRSWVWAGRARREYRMMEAFCRHGVPTVRPVAFGERREGGLLRESWFLGRWVPGALPLDAALAQAAPGDVERLVRGALELAGELHAHPFLHRDLHAGNLLLCPGGDLLVTDLHSAWRVPRLTRRMRLAMLARLLFSLRSAIPLDRCAGLLETYARARGERLEDLALDLQRALQAFEADYVRGRSARCMRVSSEFVHDSLDRGRVFRRREYAPAQLEIDLEGHRRAVAEGGPTLLGAARRSQVTLQDGGRVVKAYSRGGLLACLRQVLGRGRARGAWKAARRLEVLGIPTPRALALVERPGGSAFLVTRAVGGGVLREMLSEPPPPARRAGLARAAGYVAGRLSGAGLRHDDLCTKNLMVCAGPWPHTRDARHPPPAGVPLLQLIDLDNLCRTAPHHPAAQARMLGQLGDLPAWVTRADRRRFVLAWERSAGRALPAAVARRAAKRARARQRRRGSAARPER